MSSDMKSCSLCPRNCGVNRVAGERGVCGASTEVMVARAALHMWEEPPISASSGSGAVFYSNCPLRCAYCQNRVISWGQEGEVVSVERLADIYLELQGQGALNVNMVTPTHYAPQIREAVLIARRKGLHLPIVWNTSGYESVEAIRDNADFVDVYLTDFKYADPSLGERYSSVPDYPSRALAALDAMVEQVGPARYDVYDGQERMVRGVIVRHMMLPGSLEDSVNVVRMLHERYASSIRLSLMSQFTPALNDEPEASLPHTQGVLARFPELGRKVPPCDYEMLLDFADMIGVEDYFWQVGDPAQESFIPSFDGTGVHRADPR